MCLPLLVKRNTSIQCTSNEPRENKKEISRIRQPIFIIFEIVIVIFDNNHENVSHISIQTLKSQRFYHIFLPCDKVAMLVDNTMPCQLNAFTEFVLKRSYVPSGVQSRKRLLFCQPTVQLLHQMHTSNYYEHRVRTGPGKPGESWNFILAFSRTGKSRKKGYWSWKDLKIC